MPLDYERLYPQSVDIKESINHRIAYCSELISSGREAEAAELINYHIGNNHIYGVCSSADVLKLMAKEFNNKEILFNLIIDVYSMDGYFFPRQLITLAKRISKDIPESDRLRGLPNEKIITVYRGSYTPLSKESILKSEPSWTTSKNVAIWFAYRDSMKHDACHVANNPHAFVYQAEIPREKIIAYITERDEFEVLQYQNVRNIQLLEISEGEIYDGLRSKKKMG